MKAMIFAAGLGTRLRPLTDNRPKALVQVNDVAMIDRVVARLRGIGVRQIVVNVHHQADMLVDYLRRYPDVVISDERDCLLDTGGGVLAARELLGDDEPIMLYNADILSDVDLNKMTDAHNRSNADVTLLVDPGRKSSRKLLFDASGRMAGWMNETDGTTKPTGLDIAGLTHAAFGGIHIIEPRIFPALQRYADTAGRVFSITPFYIEACRKNNILGYIPEEPYQWFDIGSIEKLTTAENTFKE